MTDPRFASSSSSGWSLVNTIKQSRPVDLTKPYDPSTLRNKTIIITGGSSGFGAAFSREWASHGAQIIIGDLDDSAGTKLITELNTSFPLENGTSKHHFQHCDVTNWQDQVSLFKLARQVSPTGCINGVVAGAGIVETRNLVEGPTFEIPHPSHDDDVPPEPRLKVLAVNITGVMYTVHLALFHLERNPVPSAKADRHILLISSVAGLIPLPGQVEYTVSKHGVMGLFRSLRSTAYTRQGVRVNVINPYFVETPLINDRGVGLLAGGAMAKLEDVLDAATRLMADEGIIGRGLAIGPKVKVLEDDPETGAGDFTLDTSAEGKGNGREKAVWEIYGHDYDQVEVFTWRFLRLLNLVTAVRGWMGILSDLFRLRKRNLKEPGKTTGLNGSGGVRSGRVEKKKTR
ncbi:5'-hydroxyaverantin dehydrogenase [Naviculisporaceae sp. PSN 640]